MNQQTDSCHTCHSCAEALGDHKILYFASKPTPWYFKKKKRIWTREYPTGPSNIPRRSQFTFWKWWTVNTCWEVYQRNVHDVRLAHIPCDQLLDIQINRYIDASEEKRFHGPIFSTIYPLQDWLGCWSLSQLAQGESTPRTGHQITTGLTQTRQATIQAHIYTFGQFRITS